MSADDLDSTTKPCMLYGPQVVDELNQADADYAAGNTITGEDLRKRYGLS